MFATYGYSEIPTRVRATARSKVRFEHDHLPTYHAPTRADVLGDHNASAPRASQTYDQSEGTLTR